IAEPTSLPDGHFSARFLDVTLHSAFQPIFRLVKGEPVLFACEGLARPFVDGLPITPPQFFSRLNPSELLEAEQILRQLHLRNARSLPHQAKRLFLNFDPGAMQSMHNIAGDIDLLVREMRASSLNPNDVICEIVEHRAFDTAVMKEFVYALRARGFIIAVDDYGSDHADAARVKALVPDIVKIEGKIVRKRMATPDGFVVLIDQISSFAKDGILTLLEGLESPWHLELALKSGAAYAQGFILGMPQIVPCDFSEWINKPETVAENEPGLVKFFR
ncbi:MAG: EAL domain-containing protein, partial [Pseudomonadota bacterium]